MTTQLRKLLLVAGLVLGGTEIAHAAATTSDPCLHLDDEDQRPAWWPAHRPVPRDLRPAVVDVEPVRGDPVDGDEDRNPDEDSGALDLTIRF